MAVLITGMDYEEHGDCSELKREIHIRKEGLKYIAEAFKNYDFHPINRGRYSYRKILKDIEKYKKDNFTFYNGYEGRIVPCIVKKIK